MLMSHKSHKSHSHQNVIHVSQKKKGLQNQYVGDNKLQMGF